jgi:hypothetical protein
MPLTLTMERAVKGLSQKPSPRISGGVGFTIFVEHRERRIHEDQRARLVQRIGRPETDDAAFVLGQPVDPAARGAVERHLVAVADEEVLAEVFAELLEEIAQMSHDRVVAQHGVLLLRAVLDVAVDETDVQNAEHGRPLVNARISTIIGETRWILHFRLRKKSRATFKQRWPKISQVAT